MDAILLEFAKYGLAGILCGIVCGVAILLLRNLISRTDRLDADVAKSAAESLSLVKSQIIARDADLSWARANIDRIQGQFLDALRAERDSRERQTTALLTLLQSDHKEQMSAIEEVRELVASLAGMPHVAVARGG